MSVISGTHPQSDAAFAGFDRCAVSASRSKLSRVAKQSLICQARSLWPSIKGVCASARLTRIAGEMPVSVDAAYTQPGATISAIAARIKHELIVIRDLARLSGDLE